ncbi:unnamed protein product, partial [Polarella glacialis]
ESTPGWSLRYCELAGVAKEDAGQHLLRRQPLKPMPGPSGGPRQNQPICEVKTEDNSVFFASKGFDVRIAKFAEKERKQSRLKCRRSAITSFGQSRMQATLAVKKMCQTRPDTMRMLFKVCEMKVSKDGQVLSQQEMKTTELKQLSQRVGMSETEIQNLFTTFNHYDFDCSGSLDENEVRNVMADQGLQARNREEKAEVAECIADQEKVNGSNSFRFEGFLQLLKAVRQRLRELQAATCMHIFHTADVDGSESLDLHEIIHILEHKLGLKPHSMDETMEVAAIFGQCDGDGDGLVNLDEFQTFVQRARARLLTMRREEEMNIAKSFDLDGETMREFRADLPMLWAIYQRYCRQDPDSADKKSAGVPDEDLQ